MGEPNSEATPPPNVGNDSSATPDWYKNPPAWYQNSPAPQPPQNPGTNRSELISEISGLPDKIVNAIREAFPTPTPGTPPTNNTANTTPEPSAQNSSSPDPTPGKRNSFAEWWFRG
jgi:hypothetical protein